MEFPLFMFLAFCCLKSVFYFGLRVSVDCKSDYPCNFSAFVFFFFFWPSLLSCLGFNPIFNMLICFACSLVYPLSHPSFGSLDSSICFVQFVLLLACCFLSVFLLLLLLLFFCISFVVLFVVILLFCCCRCHHCYCFFAFCYCSCSACCILFFLSSCCLLYISLEGRLCHQNMRSSAVQVRSSWYLLGPFALPALQCQCFWAKRRDRGAPFLLDNSKGNILQKPFLPSVLGTFLGDPLDILEKQALAKEPIYIYIEAYWPKFVYLNNLFLSIFFCS